MMSVDGLLAAPLGRPVIGVTVDRAASST